METKRHGSTVAMKGGVLCRMAAVLLLVFGFALAVGQTTADAAGPPTVTNVNPSSGPVAGGNQVILTGTNFTGATSVKFGLTSALFLVNSATTITAAVPASAGGPGTVNVFVTNADGTNTATLANRYTYLSSTTVTGLSPTSGPFTGGTTVTVFGSGFTGTTSVRFGGIEAAYLVDSDTRIRALSPAVGASAIVHVRVTSPSGTSAATSASEFTYFGANLAVTDVTPDFGPVTGGNTVIITGSGFLGVDTVRFGGIEASFFVQSDTRITAFAPPVAGPGATHVVVSSGLSNSPVSDGSRYTYRASTPAISGISPSSGPLRGGTVVTISGSNFTGATSVTFGGVGASFIVNSSTQITATAPGAVSPGVVSVRVTTPAGTSNATSASNYSYQAPPGPQFCPMGPFWMDDLRYGSAGAGFYWDQISGLVWTAERGWHLFGPRPPRSNIQPYWADALTYGSAGGGFYWDSVSGQVWTAERGWHLYSPTGCVPR